MARAGYMIRQAQEQDRIAAQACPCCGHREGEHRELERSRWEWRDGEAIEIVNPDHQPGVFHCGHENCSCRTRVVGFGRTRRLVAA
jgi:hypothetical protein